jgi:hypothetical protein
MRDIELLLKLLAEHVYTAQPPIRDAGDFRDWLLKCSELAGTSATVEQFIISLRKEEQ